MSSIPSVVASAVLATVAFAAERTADDVMLAHGVNGTVAHNASLTYGHYLLWVGFVAMTVCSIWSVLQASNFKPGQRRLHYVAASVTSIASLSYLCMSLGVGVDLTFGRARYVARYWDWMFTTPLLLIDLGMLAGAHSNEIGFAVVCDVLMIVSGLVALNTVDNTARWVLFIFGCVALVPIIHSLMTNFGKSGVSNDSSVSSKYSTLSGMTVILWAAYPVVWAVTEGTPILSLDVEVLLYAVLDITAKAIFSVILLSSNHVVETVTKETDSLLS